MKLEILLRSTGYSTTFEAVSENPDNRGISGDDLLWLQGQNQEGSAIDVGVDEEFVVEGEQIGYIEGFVDDIDLDRTLEGVYKIGDSLDPGTYYFDGTQVVGPVK